MNVAITVKEFPPDIIGGTETQTRRMARALSETGHDVPVYTKAYGRETEIDEPYEIVRVPNCRRSSFLSTLTYLLALTALLVRDRNEIDVLQCMMIYPNGFVGTVVHYLTGVPYFAWIRGGDYYFMKANPVKRWLIRTVLWDTTVLVQSAAVRADVTAEFDPTDVRVLLDRYELCESDLHGLLAEFRAAGLIAEERVAGERGYEATETTREAVRALRGTDE